MFPSVFTDSTFKKRKKDKKDFFLWRTLLRMVNRRMGNRSITSLRSRRRQTTVSHSRAGLNTDSRNPCRTASRSNTDNRNLMDSLSRRCRSMVSRGRCRTVSPPCPQPTASQPAVPQPAMPQYAQSQQYGQPQPPMPGNFPSQQAGAAAKNKPPVAIIIGAVAAVVVIALAAVFFLTNRVSRSDYEEALVQTQALESSYTAINEEFSSASSATDNDSSSAYDEDKKKLKTFKQDSDKLAAMKAVKKDKDVKEKYETFEQDRAKYERYMNDLAQTMPALMKMTHTCTKLPKFDSADMSSYYRDLSKALESCAADAGDLAKVPIKSYAEYGADMQESVSKKKDIVDQMADLNLNDIEYGSADYEKLQDLHSKMSDIDSPTLDQSDLQKAAKEADLSGSLKDLETTLSEKIK